MAWCFVKHGDNYTFTFIVHKDLVKLGWIQKHHRVQMQNLVPTALAIKSDIEGFSEGNETKA